MTLIGYLTWYYLINQPLRCGGVYNPSTTPWIAMDIDAGYAACGDRVIVTGEDNIEREFIVRDSGWLSRYCIQESDQCTQIIGDLSKHGVWWEGLSTRVVIENIDIGTRTGETSESPTHP